MKRKPRHKDPKGQVHFFVQFNLSKVEGNEDICIFDAGASHHFFEDREKYVTYKPLHNQELALQPLFFLYKKQAWLILSSLRQCNLLS